MRDAVIVFTARTPIGRAYRGAFNATPSPTLAAHAIREAVARTRPSIGIKPRPDQRSARMLSPSYQFGEYQIGEVQARSLIAALHLGSCGTPSLSESRVLHRQVGFSSTRT